MRKTRNQFLVVAYYMTGARLAELVAANMGAIYQEDDRWWRDVIGKGAKPRRLPVSQKLLVAFEEYRAAYRLLPRTVHDDKTRLALTSRGGFCVPPRALFRMPLKEYSKPLRAWPIRTAMKRQARPYHSSSDSGPR
jgi:integrase